MAQSFPLAAPAALFFGEQNNGEAYSGEGGLPHSVLFSPTDNLPLANIESDGEAPIPAGVRFAEPLPLSRILLVSTLTHGHFSAILAGFATFPAPVDSTVELPKIGVRAD
jgi:hypothetical protein